MSRVFEALQQSTGSAGLPWAPNPSVEAAPVAIAGEPEVETLSLDGVPTLPTAIPASHRLVSLTDERSLGAEKIRVLSARLGHLQQQRPLKKLLITSTVRDEGKSTVAANLAITLARRSRQRTLLIDGDVRQRSLEQLLAVPGIPGLTDCWKAEDGITNYLRRAEGFPLWFLSAGTPQEQPLEMLQSQKMSALLAEISAWFDWVIIDSPPMLPLADSSVWSQLVDGVLFVVRQGKTAKKPLLQALQSFDKAKIAGVLINDCNRAGHQYSYQYDPLPGPVSPKNPPMATK